MQKPPATQWVGVVAEEDEHLARAISDELESDEYRTDVNSLLDLPIVLAVRLLEEIDRSNEETKRWERYRTRAVERLEREES